MNKQEKELIDGRICALETQMQALVDSVSEWSETFDGFILKMQEKELPKKTKFIEAPTLESLEKQVQHFEMNGWVLDDYSFTQDGFFQSLNAVLSKPVRKAIK